jgi:hypothetical protein
VLLLIRRLGLGTPVVEQQFRRMVFNVVARNQDCQPADRANKSAVAFLAMPIERSLRRQLLA